MDEINKLIKKLAETHGGNPDKFISVLEKLSGVPQDKKGYLFLEIGIFLFNLSYLRLTLAVWSKALGYFLKEKDKLGESKCYGNLGTTYYSLGDFSKAVEYYNKSLKVGIEIGDKAGESKCYTNLGNAYLNLGDFRKAVEYHKKALEIAREIGDKAGESICYTNLGTAYSSLRDFRKAIQYHERALEIDREIGINRQGESICYTNLGTAYSSLGDFRKAIQYHERALEIAKEIGDIDSERITTYNLAFIYGRNLNESELAYNYSKRSIELSELITGKLIEEEHKIGFTSRTSDAYQYIVPLCLKLNKKSEAFEFLEKGKSRVFLDLLAATEIKPSIKVTPELEHLVNEEKEYLAKFRKIQTRHLSSKKVTVEPGEIDKITKKLDLIYSKIEKFDPEYVFTRRGKPLSFTKLQDTLTSQKKDTVLIEYFVTRDKVFIFIVSSRDRKLHIEEVSISQERLNLYIENYWRSVSRYLSFQDIRESWPDLSKYLINPISKYLIKEDLIYFIPYGLLHYLPLHALELNNKPLIRSHPVTYSPSASIIRLCQNKGSGKLESCVSFGVDFGDEVKAVAKVFKGKAITGNMVTKEKVIKICNDKDIIHFYCHSIFNSLDPLSSGILLHGGETLTAREIFNLKLNTELVTLSACQTGISEVSPGDELVGITRAFLYAGAPSVVVSLWPVDDKSTQELMLEFYKLIKNGEDKATALQKAQVKIMDKEEYSHSYYWAPFILVGDWE